jgi:hypothetical protein
MKSFDRDDLGRRGFGDFRPLGGLVRDYADVPAVAGVYVVVLEPAPCPEFLERSVGGHFKGKDPTVSISVLRDNRVEDRLVLYIGRASSLRERLRLLARYGKGENVAHRGGRLLWQISAHADLEVAWCPHEDPIAAETELLDEFVEVNGTLPFANLVRGRRPTGLAV